MNIQEAINAYAVAADKYKRASQLAADAREAQRNAELAVDRAFKDRQDAERQLLACAAMSSADQARGVLVGQD